MTMAKRVRTQVPLRGHERSAGPVWVVGACFLIGGIVAVAMLSSPVWFTVVDLVLAYLPMAWLGHRWAARGGRPA